MADAKVSVTFELLSRSHPGATPLEIWRRIYEDAARWHDHYQRRLDECNEVRLAAAHMVEHLESAEVPS